VLQVARETVAARQLTLRQVTRPVREQAESSLDVSFAEVNLSKPSCCCSSGERHQGGPQELAAAMGLDTLDPVELKDELLPDPLGDLAPAGGAGATQPSGAARIEAPARFRSAVRPRRKSLLYPSVSVIGTAGVVPIHQDKLNGSYSGVGINVNIPILIWRPVFLEACGSRSAGASRGARHARPRDPRCPRRQAGLAERD